MDTLVHCYDDVLGVSHPLYLSARDADVVLRNAERPSEWAGNALPPHVSTREGLQKATEEFLRVNPHFLPPDYL